MRSNCFDSVNTIRVERKLKVGSLVKARAASSVLDRRENSSDESWG